MWGTTDRSADNDGRETPWTDRCFCIVEPSATFARRLTDAQARFAQQEQATIGGRAVFDDRMVFLYREERSVAFRWLVDRHGHIVEALMFHRQAA